MKKSSFLADFSTSIKFSRSDYIVLSLNSNLKLLKNPLDLAGSELIPIKGV